MNQCKTCETFVPGATERLPGRCLRYAPKPITGIRGLSAQNRAANWPLVEPDDGCQEWTEAIVDWVDPHEAKGGE